ncbi:MAG TPA: hypothetical protein VFY16_10600 [Gemmatimonadaceae bacterium]|nr:hypothetical protein [Gemmatimonadaceae bacterium]
MATTSSSADAARDARAAKFRQAAFVYLHVALLYEAAAYVMWREGRLPATRLGPGGLWLVLGAVIALAVVFALLHWRSSWLARIIWGLHALRLPALVDGAFFTAPPAPAPPAFYLLGIAAVLVNLWMLARAGWDL